MMPTSEERASSDLCGPSRGGDIAPCDPRVARSRTKLLAAATELLVEAGPRGVTVDAVAERSGVAKSTLYRHWETRQDLLVDVMRSNIPEFTSPDLSMGFEAALHGLLDGVAATLSAPAWARIMPALISLQQHVPDMAQLVDADRRAKAVVLSEIIELGVAEGRLPPGLDPHRVVQILIGPLVFATISGHVADVGELAEHVVDRFIASYRPPSPAG